MTKQELYKNFISRADNVSWDYAIDMLQSDIEEASYEGELSEFDVARLEAWENTYEAGYKYLNPDTNDVDDDVCGEFRRVGFEMVKDYLYKLSYTED